ncbi:hypothetical protein, partial [Bartonella sp. CL32QHWL-2]|uniref:hypothetical protein n=1 Tax=Bartonella sp. CL32QHWL-2 TaxID=3243525 RepID=UPI0035D05912
MVSIKRGEIAFQCNYPDGESDGEEHHNNCSCCTIQECNESAESFCVKLTHTKIKMAAMAAMLVIRGGRVSKA